MARLTLNQYHIPVMARECLQFLQPERGGVIVDATLGGGGHARLILERMPIGSVLIAVDADEAAIKRANTPEGISTHVPDGVELNLVHDNFDALPGVLRSFPPVSAVLFDLGVSSFQFDHHPRGFSFRQDAPLDMRFTPDGPTAADLLNTLPEGELVQIIRDYGEDPLARRLASAVVRRRTLAPFRTTVDLRDTIMQHTPPQHHAKTLARMFQALRIAVNRELERLAFTLRGILPLMANDGRIVVMSYHSLEDRVVKDVFRIHAMRDGPLPRLELLTRKPIMAAEAEVEENPRARSARLRAAAVRLDVERRGASTKDVQVRASDA